MSLYDLLDAIDLVSSPVGTDRRQGQLTARALRHHVEGVAVMLERADTPLRADRERWCAEARRAVNKALDLYERRATHKTCTTTNTV
jgi:hypothetical protein